MATLNKVMLIGRLTKDPEPPRTLPNSGNRVVSFSFAVGLSKKNPQTGQWENDPNPMYIDCEAFTKDSFTRLVDVITNYCRKGSQVFLEGRLQLDRWDDKATGQKRSKHKLVVEKIELLDKAPGSENRGDGTSGGGTSGGSAPGAGYDGDHSQGSGGSGGDDIPF